MIGYAGSAGTAEPYFEMSTVRTSAGCSVITLCGALDAGSTPHLETALAWILDARGTREVILDLTDVRYVGTSGVRALFEAAQTARARGIRLSARNAQDLVADILRVTEMADVLRLPPPMDGDGLGDAAPAPAA